MIDFIRNKYNLDLEPINEFSEYQNNIMVTDLYQVLMSIKEFQFNDGILQGDVLDLINDLDEQKTGFVNLDEFKTQLDKSITDNRYNLRLESKV